MIAIVYVQEAIPLRFDFAYIVRLSDSIYSPNFVCVSEKCERQRSESRECAVFVLSKSADPWRNQCKQYRMSTIASKILGS